MCRAGLQESKEGIRTHLKSQRYKSKAPKEAYELTDIQKEEWSSVRSILIMVWLKPFLVMKLLFNEGVDV